MSQQETEQRMTNDRGWMVIDESGTVVAFDMTEASAVASARQFTRETGTPHFALSRMDATPAALAALMVGYVLDDMADVIAITPRRISRPASSTWRRSIVAEQLAGNFTGRHGQPSAGQIWRVEQLCCGWRVGFYFTSDRSDADARRNEWIDSTHEGHERTAIVQVVE